MESSENTTPKETIFTDWSLYQKVEGIPNRVKYTPPKAREDLRERIANVPLENLDEAEVLVLKTCLSFLEGGTLEDDFGRNDEERDKFYNSTIVKLGENEISLYILSKRVNRLGGNAITRVILAGQVLNDSNLCNEANQLLEEIKKIGKEKGFFETKDLKEVDQFAQKIIDHIISNHTH